MRRTILALGAALLSLALLLLVIAAPPAFMAPVVQPLRMALVHAATAAVSRSLNGSIHIADLQGSLLGAPEAMDIEVRDAQGEALLRIDALRMSYHPGDLFRGRLRIGSLEILRPRLQLTRDGQGRLGLVRVFSSGAPAGEPPAGGPPIDIFLERLDLREGHIDMALDTPPGARRIDGLDLQARGRWNRQGLALRLERLVARASPAGVSIEGAHGTLAMAPGELRLEDLLLQTDASRITASGVVPGQDRNTDLRLTLQPFDMGEIGRLLGDETLHGTLQGVLKASGPPEAVALDGEFTAGEGVLRMEGALDAAGTPLAYRGTLELDRLDLSSLVHRPEMRSDLNARLRIRGKGLKPPGLSVELGLDVDRSRLGGILIHPSAVDLALDPDRLEVRRFELRTSVLEAHARGALDRTGKPNVEYTLSAGLADLQPFLAAHTPGGRLDLEGQAGGPWPDVSLQGRLRGADLAWDANHLHDLEIAYETTQLNADTRVDAQLNARGGRFAGTGMESLSVNVGYARTGTGHRSRFRIELRQSPALGARIEGELAHDGIRNELTLARVEADLGDHTWAGTSPLEVVFAPGRLKISPFRFTHDGEFIAVSGGLQDSDFHDLALEAGSVDLGFIRRTFGLPPWVGGLAELHTGIRGSLAVPVMEGDLTLAEEPGDPLAFQRLTLTAHYADGRLEGGTKLVQEGRQVLGMDLVMPLDLALAAMPVERRLMDGKLRARLDLDRPVLAGLDRAYPELPALTGSLQGALSADGTWAGIELDTRFEFLGLGIGGIVEQLQGHLQQAAKLETAPSVDDLREAMAQDKLSLEIPEMTLSSPRLDATLPGDGEARQLTATGVSLQASGGWDGTGPHGEVHELGARVALTGLPEADIGLAASLTPDRLAIDRLDMTTAASGLEADGWMSRDDGRLQFSLNIPRLEPGEFLHGLPPNIPSPVAGRADLTGTTGAPQLAAQLRWAGATIEANADARLQDTPPGYRADVKLAGLDVARFSPDMRGQIGATVNVQGSGLRGEDLAARIEVDVDSSDFSAAPGLTGRLRAAIGDATVELDELSLRGSPFDLKARGVLSRRRASDLNYSLTVHDPSPLEPILGVTVQARGGLAGSVTGTPGALRSENTLDLKSWRYGDWRGERLHARLDASDLTGTPRADLKADVAGLAGPGLEPGALELAGAWQGEGGKFSLAVTDGPFMNSRLGGTVSTGQQQRVDIDPLRLRHGDWTWRNHGPIRMERAAEGTLRLHEARLDNGDQRITARGVLTPEGRVKANLRVDHLQLQPAALAFAPAADELDGRLSLDLALGGTRERPELNGSLEISAMQWQARPLGKFDATIAMRGTQAEADARWIRGQSVLLAMDGNLDTAGEGKLAASVEAPDFDLAMLQPLSDRILDSAGRLHLDMKLSGTLRQPRADGTLRLEDGRLQLAMLGEAYNDIQTDLLFTGRRVEIKNMQVGSSTGTARLEGWAESTGLTTGKLDLRLTADRFTAMATPALLAVVSSDLRLRGTGSDMLAKGRIDVVTGRFRYEALPSSGAPAVEPWELTVEGVYGPGKVAATTEVAQAHKPPRPPPLPFLRTDILVDMPRNIWVQGNGTAVEVGGELHVKKDLERPFIVSGYVDTRKGFASFFGKKFTIERGHVTFTGTQDIDPSLDIVAVHQVSDYIVYVDISGKSSKPKIAFRSEPELKDETDILSLLVFGKTSDRLSSSEQSSLSSRAQNVAGGVASSLLEKSVGKALGLDTIAIDMGDDDTAGSVGIGRYITQDVFMSYDRTFRDPKKRDQGGNTVGLEYSINRKLKIKASGSDYGESALDFFYQYDY